MRSDRQVDTCAACWGQVAKWDGVINFLNAQWSSGRHRCGILVLGRTVELCGKFYNGQVLAMTTWVNHVGGKSHNKMM